VPLLRAAVQSAAYEKGPREIEREFRRSSLVKRVEGGEGLLELSLCRQDDRSGPRQSYIDPESRKDPSSLLEPGERAPRTLDLAESDE
jgi:hypothetical protein